MIIAVDHGYGLIKTPNFVFKTGIEKYESEPYTKNNVIEYDGNYYVCGSGRQTLVRDKTEDDSYFILTLLAIAKELEHKNIEGGRCNITLACGLPLTSIGRDKEKFIKYLKRDSFQPIRFKYQGRSFRVSIEEVMMFPQGYSAIINDVRVLKNEPSMILCDVGSWTVDAMRLDKGVPNAETCRSLEFGVIKMVDKISEIVRRVTGKSITQDQIEQVLADRPCSIDEEVKNIIKEQGKVFVNKISRTLLESGLDISAIPTLFMGGGSILVNKNIDQSSVRKLSFDDDMMDKLCEISNNVSANAVGYEKIAYVRLQKA